MSSRAERRRAEREKKWKGFDPSARPSIEERIARHTKSCHRCQTGLVAKSGCAWLSKFYAKNSQEVLSLLKQAEPVDPFDAYLFKKKTTHHEDNSIRHVDVDTGEVTILPPD